MKPKTIRITYWIATGIFALLMIADGIAGVTRQQAGIDAMGMLGYPVYFLSIVGGAKLLGAVAILQNRFRLIKEWAYAGFTFNFLAASVSWAFAGFGAFETTFPLIILGIMCVPYFFWKKYNRVQHDKGYSSDFAIA
ncbi:DoxX family protein [Chitinophaga lutea]|uniref:DoxX family protein n=1 Tax=Chitinophaga lutea TaxID=2488634 RepID=A0A3N4PLI0_9BACT|nr:DoxX family protein [Chitinophaga lutea]RPE05731.1 DoxX family protein [Chitinophaga lutea]